MDHHDPKHPSHFQAAEITDLVLLAAEEAFVAGYLTCANDTGPSGTVPSGDDLKAYAAAAWSEWVPSEAHKAHIHEAVENIRIGACTDIPKWYEVFGAMSAIMGRMKECGFTWDLDAGQRFVDSIQQPSKEQRDKQ